MSGTATDSDGSIASTEWLIGGAVVATGVSANLSLVDGSNTVTFRATDNDGGSSSTSVNINISVANELPTVAIAGGNRNIADSDGVTGETVSFSATATDADGSVSSTQWLVGGSVVATGATANLSLSDGSTSVTFKATDNAGGSASTDVTINVDAPHTKYCTDSNDFGRKQEHFGYRRQRRRSRLFFSYCNRLRRERNII